MSEHSGYLFIGGPLDGERIAVPEGKLEYVHPHPNVNCEGGMEVHRYLREHLIDGRARLWIVYTADYVNGLELMYSRYPSPKREPVVEPIFPREYCPHCGVEIFAQNAAHHKNARCKP